MMTSMTTVINHGRHIWAKTDMNDMTSTSWLSLAQHLTDTMMVSRLLWDHWLSSKTRDWLDDALHGHGREVLSFLAGVHDVGKCSPAFEKQASYRPDLMAMLSDNGYVIPPDLGKSGELRHETAGFFALSEWFAANDMPVPLSRCLAIIVGGHHGVYHSRATYHDKRHKREYYGAGEWSSTRTAIIDDMASMTGFTAIMRDLDADAIIQPIQSVLTGIVVVADWIASSAYLFPLCGAGTVTNEDARVRRAWDTLGFPTPWTYTRPASADAMLETRFGLTRCHANGMQSLAVDIARGASGPTMMIIESPMGSGKTEAALMAAEALSRTQNAGGLVFALPTQATANGILPRFAQWLTNSTDGSESLELLHGAARLNKNYDRLRAEQTFDNDGNVGIEVNTWFDGSKRGLLANFVVCTIDQILMSALQSKHFDLRHLGLSGKTVIIDEVHAADDYMAVYLDRALEWLGALKCSVILLSATLPRSRREAMANAYHTGLCGNMEVTTPRTGYPMITTVNSTGVSASSPVGRQRAMASVHVHHLCESRYVSVESLLADKLANGGNAAVICNTVSSAQSHYEALRTLGYDTILIHSRFIASERARIEDVIRSRYGRDGSHRPRRSIVVGTQVLEQSLDIDFDIMVSEIAPIDLMLQRAGRLHRHDHVRPADLEAAELWVDGWRREHGRIVFDPGSLSVYGTGHAHKKVPGKLLAAFGLLRQHPVLSIPGDIPVLVDKGYGSPLSEFFPDSPEEDEIESSVTDMNDNTKVSESLATTFLLRSPSPAASARPGEFITAGETHPVLWGSNERARPLNDEKARAQVRDTDTGLSVVMMKRAGDGLTFVPSNGNGLVIGTSTPPDDDLAREIMTQTISLPASLSGPWVVDAMIRWLERRGLVAAWQQSPWLKGQPVMILDEGSHLIVDIDDNRVFNMTYDDDMGLIVERVNTHR
jgi:CRISPR-associated helicase Cas3/CRISPR-associated endonuclease Cas3-HD